MLQLTETLDASAALPLYEQLYRSLAAQMRSGALPAGTRMPGKRSLAAELSVSVNTIDTAYQLLAAEGYLESRARSGFYVQEYLALPAAPRAGGRSSGGRGTAEIVRGAATPERGAATSARSATTSARNKPTAECSAITAECNEAAAECSAATSAYNKPTAAPAAPDTSVPQSLPRAAALSPAAAPPVRYDLSTGGVDTALFPFRTWGRLQKELLYSSPELLAHGEAQGDENLRAALAGYLAAYRGVRCTPEQVVVGAGVEYLLSLLAPLLSGPAAVEEPGYPRARAIFENNGVVCRGLPVDESGLSVQALDASDAQVCYITPSHQFPTGVTMPAGRRAALLRWAAPGTGRFIVEDDYDSEFRFDTRPLPSLQGMAGADGPVIYLSTCSRSLAPSIRIAYMVLPQSLVPLWRAKYRLYSSTVSRFEQQTLARFITEGYFARHLARERNTYKARRTVLADALTEAFGAKNLQLSGLHTGLHLLLTLKNGVPDTILARRAAEAGIRCAPLSAYYHDESVFCPPGTLVLGYGALDTSLCAAAAAALKNACTAAAVSSPNS